MNKLKIVSTVLFIATIVWGIVFYIDFQEFHKLLEDQYIHYDLVGELLSYFGGCNSGRFVIFSGLGLLISWAAFIVTTPLREILSAFVAAVRGLFHNEKEG